MLSFLQKIFLLGLFFCGNIAFAQPKFIATISSTEINKNELVQYKLSVENANQIQQINTPNFKNFTVVSGPNQETGIVVINGNAKKYTSITFILKPNLYGSFTIASTAAKADGKDLQSNTVSIKVNNNLPPVSINRDANTDPENVFGNNILYKNENINDKINKNIFIKLQVDKTTCYVGEPIVATYKLFTRLKSESNLSKSPSYNGFSVIDLQQTEYGNCKRENFDGKDYNVYIIRKSELYPLQSGTVELESAEIENNITFIKEAYAKKNKNSSIDILENIEDVTDVDAIIKQKITLQSNPVFINVKPLPAVNIPTNFSGAVGNIKLKATAQKTTFATHEAGKIRLTIWGEGNLQLINAPEIQWPHGFDVFEPITFDSINKATVPVSGEKIFTYSFSVGQPGTYILPAIKFSYFNPKEKKYITDSTKPISFEITKVIKENLSIANKTIDEHNSYFTIFFKNRLHVVSAVAILILSGLMIWLKREKKLEQQQQQMANQQKVLVEKSIATEVIYNPKNWLQKSATLLQEDSKIFYSELNGALKNFLSAKLCIPIEAITKKNIAEELDKKNIAVNVSIQLQQLMNQIELQLYTPFAEKEKMQELFYNVQTMIQTLDAYKI